MKSRAIWVIWVIFTTVSSTEKYKVNKEWKKWPISPIFFNLRLLRSADFNDSSLVSVLDNGYP